MERGSSTNPFLSYNPFLGDFVDGGRDPGSELDRPGGPLYVPPSPSVYSYEDSASVFADPPPQSVTAPVFAADELPRHAPGPHVVLPPFRPNNPAAWFGMVDNIFRLRRVHDQRDMYAYAIAVLGEDQLLNIEDLLALCPPPPDAFNRLRDRLIATHQLDNYQRTEQLLDLPALGGQRPSVLLAQMRQLVPPGEENGWLFRCLFLRRLPREVRLALAEDRHSPVAALAARADALVVHRDSSVAAVAAAVDDPVVAPVTAGGRPPQQSKRPDKRAGGKKERRKKVGVCYSHWKFGDDAWQCDQPGNCAFKSGN